MSDPVLASFARFSASAASIDLPDTVMHAAKRCVLDYMGATLPGGAIAPASLMKVSFADMLGRGSARLYPNGEITDPRTAALINGAASHTIEFDDIYRDGIYHPGVPVISAALAIAEARGVSGETFLRGVISGYEVSNRIAETVNPDHYAFWHTTGTVGTFGAAAAAATILGLDENQSLHALANAGTLAAGLQQAFRGDAMAKPMHGGHAADTGLMCALAASAGVTGIPDMLEGERGFGQAMCGGPDWSKAAKTLGSDYTILRMTVKNHAACGHAHAAIDGALHLQNEHGFKASEIAKIEAGTYGPAVEIVGAQEVSSAFEAKFSLPYCVAVTLLDGSCRTKAFTDERRADPDIHALAKRIFVSKDDACDAAFPKRRSANISITLTDGRELNFFSPTRKGDPDAPLTDTELSEKYRELAVDVIGSERASALENKIWSLETLPSISELYPDTRAAAE